MELNNRVQFGWTEGLILLLLLAVLSVSGRALYLRARANRLKQSSIPTEKENLRKTKQLVSRIRSVQSDASEQVENQREKLQSLETVLTGYLREAGFSNAMKAINPTRLQTRKLEREPYRRGGIRFTIEDLPLPYLARTLHMLEKRFPALQTLRIQLTRLASHRSKPDVIKKGSVTLVYYLPIESQ